MSGVSRLPRAGSRSWRAGSRAERTGAPAIGTAVPAWSIGALGLVAGVLGSVVVIGASGWLVVAVVLAVAAAVFPRGPFAAVLVTQLAIAGLAAPTGPDVAVLVLTTHVVLATSLLWAWTPRTARVQLRALRRSALRFVAVQIGAQALGFVVVVVFGDAGAIGGVWLAIVGAVALLALAVGLFVPVLLRAGDDAEG